jgi:ribosome-associated protein
VHLRINNRLSLPLNEIEIRTGTSSGPGGQHANRSQTRVEAVFRPERSTTLSESQQRRIRARLGATVTGVSQDERSQARNREMALERLAAKLAAALRVPKRRTPTRPSQAAKERRLAAKKRRGEIKSARRRPGEAD